MTRSLVAAGVLLVTLGIVIVGMLAIAKIEPSDRVPLIGEEQGRLDRPARLWSFAGGLALAGGAGCIGLGMNRWRQNGRASAAGR